MNKSYFIGDRNKSQNEWISVRNLDRLLDQLEFDMNRRMELDHHSPYSPLECEVNAMTQCNYLKKVRIARDSINFVLLDEEPEVRCSSLLVTSRIEINNMKDNGLVIRNTCLFPKIKGLVSLCLLAFSPAVELRQVEKKLSYTRVKIFLELFYLFQSRSQAQEVHGRSLRPRLRQRDQDSNLPGERRRGRLRSRL